MTTKQQVEITQQEFLRDAAKALNLTQKGLAERMCAPWHTFNKWLQPSTSLMNYREMPDIAWQLVREILENEDLKKQVAKKAKKLK